MNSNWYIRIWLGSDKGYSPVGTQEFPSRAEAAKHLTLVPFRTRITRDQNNSTYNVIVTQAK